LHTHLIFGPLGGVVPLKTRAQHQWADRMIAANTLAKRSRIRMRVYHYIDEHGRRSYTLTVADDRTSKGK
jgi:hypothetical protein